MPLTPSIRRWNLLVVELLDSPRPVHSLQELVRSGLQAKPLPRTPRTRRHPLHTTGEARYVQVASCEGTSWTQESSEALAPLVEQELDDGLLDDRRVLGD